jgi:hypothetical protein
MLAIKIWELKKPDKREQFQQLPRTKSQKYETQSEDGELERFKPDYTETEED